jgi:phospholipid/cholesterol/gamma-HCH transport system substrate-binding protein
MAGKKESPVASARSGLERRFRHWRYDPPLKTSAFVMAFVMVLIVVLVFLQYHGDFLPRARLTVMASRAGLEMDPGAKVTYNGVEIGRVGAVDAVEDDGKPRARLTLDITPRYLALIPRNVDTTISASTVFGNKYVSFTSPKHPSPQHITPSDVIDVTSAPTEFNTLFDTVVELAHQVDPIKLNQTLSATAEALDGLGDRVGQSIVEGNQILSDINVRMPQIHRDNRLLANLADVYATSAPDLFDGLQNAATTADTFNDLQDHLDWALMAAIGFGNTGADVFGRGGPFLVRTARDLIPTSGLLDSYSPALFCTLRNYHDVQSKVAATVGGNGYSARTITEIVGAGNPYVYPDNLPRINARGGPEGKPGCWQPITRDLWPAPYLVMDTGASIAPYNHLGLGQPSLTDYVWGRQVGANTINP